MRYPRNTSDLKAHWTLGHWVSVAPYSGLSNATILAFVTPCLRCLCVRQPLVSGIQARLRHMDPRHREGLGVGIDVGERVVEAVGRSG